MPVWCLLNHVWLLVHFDVQQCPPPMHFDVDHVPRCTRFFLLFSFGCVKSHAYYCMEGGRAWGGGCTLLFLVSTFLIECAALLYQSMSIVAFSIIPHYMYYKLAASYHVVNSSTWLHVWLAWYNCLAWVSYKYNIIQASRLSKTMTHVSP